MRSIKAFFESELDKHVNPENYLDPRQSPEKLIKDLHQDRQLNKLLKIMRTPNLPPMKALKLMSTLNQIMLFSNDFYEFIEQNLKCLVTEDVFVNQKFIEPYYKYLIKSCITRDMHSQCKGVIMSKTQHLQMLFYTINMLRLLFAVVNKMPFLGRYYKLQHNSAVSTFVEVIALQAQKIYYAFKVSLGEIINNHQKYITDKNTESIIKLVLTEELISINQEMKKLYLDKYFYPLGKGIGVKLFKPDEQSPENSKIIHGIVSNHQQTQRRRQKKELEDNLFTRSGLVNWNFYEETMNGGPLENSGLDSSKMKQLDDIVLSEEEECQSPEISKEKGSMKKSKESEAEAETNSGTQHVKYGRASLL